MIWNDDMLEVMEHKVEAFSVSSRCRMVEGFEEWIFSGGLWSSMLVGSG